MPTAPKSTIFHLDNLRSVEGLRSFVSQYKNIVLVGGCFDVLHFGHITFLQKAKKEGGDLIVLLEPDTAVREKKKRKPIHTQEERANMLTSLRFVDGVIVIPPLKTDAEYEAVTKEINPSIIAVTQKDPYMRQKKNIAKLLGAQVRTVTGKVGNLSTSYITNYAAISRN